MRFLFTTAPLAGHFYPLVPLAWACRAQGHDVLVASTDHFVATAQQSGLPVAACGPGFALSEWADAGAAFGVGNSPQAHGDVLGLMAQRNLAGTLSTVDAWRPDVVISERSEFAGPVAAAERGLPHVQIHWGVSELAEYREAARERLGELPAPATVWNTWPPSLRHSFAAGHLSLRHVPFDGPATVPQWMQRTPVRPRICLTLGTILPLLGARDLTGFVLEIADQLSRLDTEIVLAVDDGFARSLPSLPDAVVHAGRVPLSQVLRTSRILIHHGGQGSCLTGLAAGCAQVVLPKFDDMFANAQAVVSRGAGMALPLDEAAPEGVAKLCRQLLDSPWFAEAAGAIADEIATQPSPADVVKALEGVVHD